MPAVLDGDALDLGCGTGAAVAGAGPAGLRAVGAGWGLAQAGDVRPLLDLFGVVGVAEDRVVGSVPELHSRALARVAGVHAAGGVTPLLRGPDDAARLLGLLPKFVTC